MELFGLTITRTKQTGTLSPVESRGGWWPLLRESYAGAWQQNVTVELANVLTHPTVYACVTLIASDISKMRLRLVEQDADGIWTETETPAFSPVLRKPNRYQTRVKFFEWWVTSKLVHGNAYILKERDNRGVVIALYILDPTRVRVLVAPDGEIYYDLKRDDLSGLPQEHFVVPAREIIHDVMNPLYHPLVGISPISACGLAAVLGLNIEEASALLFANGAKPGGILTAPGPISQTTAERLKAHWDTNYSGANVGKVAVLGDGLRYEGMAQTAKDSALTEQADWVSFAICSAFHVPPYMVGVGDAPPYNNTIALKDYYYSQCLQGHIESMELVLDEGLELPKPYGTEFDLEALLRMDMPTRFKAAADGIGSGALSPNEARARFFDLGPVAGGETPYLQQQYYSLAALSERDREKPFAKPPAGAQAPAAPAATDDEDGARGFELALMTRSAAMARKNASPVTNAA